MKRLLTGCAALALAASFATAVSAGPLAFTLSGVTFDDGTSLTGGFTIDDTTGDVLSFNISSQNGLLPAQTYSTGDVTFRDFFASNQYLFVNPQLTQYLALNFVNPLAAGTDALSTTSYECSNCGAVRWVVSGAAVSGAVPEPASWAMMVGGFGVVGGAMRSRRKVAVRFA